MSRTPGRLGLEESGDRRLDGHTLLGSPPLQDYETSAPGCWTRRIVSRVVLYLVARVWLALLIIGSLQPSRPGIVTGLHREIHWIAFGGATVLLLSLSRTHLREILAAFTIFFLGLSLEVLQHLIYRNPVELTDIRDDGLAVLAALTLYYLTGAWKPGYSQTQQ
jgi:hypothetical protein